MSVQCRKCRRLELFNKEKKQYSCGVAFPSKSLVNIKKQRECMYFIKSIKCK